MSTRSQQKSSMPATSAAPSQVGTPEAPVEDTVLAEFATTFPDLYELRDDLVKFEDPTEADFLTTLYGFSGTMVSVCPKMVLVLLIAFHN